MPDLKRAVLLFHAVVPVAEANPPSPLPRGQQLARYEWLCPIAEGGMACVWAARPRGNRTANAIVAVKTILPRFADDERFREMFRHEGAVASRIAHPNVARVTELGEERGLPYMVMEYIDGEPLAKLDRACRRAATAVPTGIALRILADVCAGLHEAHELADVHGRPLGLVHHDVSPHNILVAATGVSKLIDFGIAKTAASRSEDTFSGVLKGRIQYMPPEQALGLTIDRRADVWAVGAILYSLLAGKPPYDGKNHLAIVNRLAAGCPPLPLPRSVHPAVAAVARTALSWKPAGRYSTAEHLRRALESAMVEAGVATTTADVAVFSSLHLASHAEKRRRAVDLAVRAAESLPADGPPADRPRPMRRQKALALFLLAAAFVLLASAGFAGATWARARARHADETPDPPHASVSSAVAAIAESRLSVLRGAPSSPAGRKIGEGVPPATPKARRRSAGAAPLVRPH